MPLKTKLRTSSETDIQRLAREWIDALSDPNGLKGSWRLQVLEERIRTVKETVEVNGVPVEREVPERRPSRLVRFAKGCPWNLVAEAEKYLLSQAPYTGRIANGIVFDGVYRPTRTRWIRDDQTSVDDQRRATNENRHTLVQDLVETSAAGDGDGVTTSDDCVETVSTEYHWDEPSVPDASSLPLSGQGVTVSVQQVARQEDGTYRYAIVTRTAKTRIGAEVTVECTEFQTVTQCDCVNLFGDPSDAFDGRVPVPCSAARGTTVEWRNLKQNDDCTWNVTILKTVAKSIVSDKVTSKTLTEERSTVKTAAEASELAPAPAPANGVTYEHRSEKRPDGKFDNTVTSRAAQPVLSQVTETRRTVRGVTNRVINRNQTSTATLPANTIGSVVNTRTEAGLYDQDLTTVAQGEQLTAGEGCQKTLFEHTHTSRQIQSNLPTGDVPAPASGTHIERESRITEEGSYDVTTRVTAEQRVADAQVVRRKTLRGVQTTTVNRNVASPLPSTAMKVGETRQSEKTPGGLYTTTQTVTTAEAAGEIAAEKRKTKFEETSSTVVNQNAKGADAAAAGNGETHRTSSRRTEEGTWDVTSETVKEVAQTGASTTWRKTARGTQKTVVDRNATTALNESGLPVGGSRTTELTPGGRFNNTTTTFAAATNQTVGVDKQRTVFESTDSETKVQNQASDDISAAGGGTTRRTTSRLNDEGTWDVTTQTTSETEKKGATKSWRKTLRGVQETVVDRNAGTALTSSGMKVGETRTTETTPGGKYNNTTVKTTASDAGNIGVDCRKTVYEHVHSKTLNQQLAPSDDVRSAGGGVVTQQSARQTDEGTWDVTTQTTEEQSQTGAAKTWRKTLRGTQVTTVDRNVDAPLSGSGLAVGETRQSEKTPGGKYNNTTTKVTATSAGTIGSACEQSAGLHKHSTTSIQGSQPTGDVSATANHSRSRVARQTDEGTWEVVSEHTEYKSDRRELVLKNPLYTERITTGVNQTSAPSLSGGTNTVVDASVSLNDHGSLSVNSRSRSYHSATARATGGSGTVRETVEVGVNAQSVPHLSAGMNSVVEPSVSINEHGTLNYQVRQRVFKPVSATAISKTGAVERSTTTTINNQKSTVSPSGEYGSTSASPNDHGSYSTTVTNITPKMIDTGKISWTAFEKTHTTKTWYRCWIRILKNVKVATFRSMCVAAGDENLHVEASLNEYGLVDGRLSGRKLERWERYAENNLTGGYKVTVTSNKTFKTFWGHGYEGDEATAQHAAVRALKPTAGVYGRTYVY